VFLSFFEDHVRLTFVPDLILIHKKNLSIMNLILLLVSLLFNSYAPTTETTSDGTTVTEPGDGKGGKFGDRDFIIGEDLVP